MPIVANSTVSHTRICSESTTERILQRDAVALENGIEGVDEDPWLFPNPRSEYVAVNGPPCLSSSVERSSRGSQT